MWLRGQDPLTIPEKTIIKGNKMSRKSSIVLQYHKEIKYSYLYHNDRSKPTKNSIFPTDNNYYNLGSKNATKLFYKTFKEREEVYKQTKKRKLHKNTIKHISAIVNLDHFHTKEDMKKLVKYLEEKLDTKVIQFAIHKDEGFIDENGEKHINYHAHIEMLGLDSQGRSIRKKITRGFLKQLQTDVAKILRMERGTDRRITKRKRLDTYEYKEHIKRVNEIKQPLKYANKLVSKKYSNLKKEKEQLEEKIKQLEQKNKQLENENNLLKNEIEKLKIELGNIETTKEYKEKIYKLNKFIKDIKKIIVYINKQLEVFRKEDYDKISKLQKEIRMNKKLKNLLEQSETLKKLEENTFNLFLYIIDKFEKHEKEKQLLIQEIKRLQKEYGITTNYDSSINLS